MKLKRILISQPAPAEGEQSPYRDLAAKYNLDLTFFKFFETVGVTASEFRKTRIHLQDYSAVIFNSRLAIDHFFRLAKELRVTIPDSMKYFCTTDAIGNYLQTYVQYRKRKVFTGQQHFAELIDILSKHREESFIFPCSDEKQTEYFKLLDKGKFKYTKATMYYSKPRDLKSFDLKSFDLIVLFSPIGVRVLTQSFPELTSEDVRIAALGTATHAALAAAGLPLAIAAPTKQSPSMAMAIENYILGKEQGSVIVAKPASLRSVRGSSRPRGTASNTRKGKSPIADKAKYKQLQEERKAQAAERRAKRAATKANEKKR
ncbi:MAG: uroporphyrinogen-III synthase [Bacteroidales bacterium]|nr:uroporphyrinogen-III synthase [Candidatus Colimorpha onthohippi]